MQLIIWSAWWLVVLEDKDVNDDAMTSAGSTSQSQVASRKIESHLSFRSSNGARKLVTQPGANWNSKSALVEREDTYPGRVLHTPETRTIYIQSTSGLRRGSPGISRNEGSNEAAVQRTASKNDDDEDGTTIFAHNSPANGP